MSASQYRLEQMRYDRAIARGLVSQAQILHRIDNEWEPRLAACGDGVPYHDDWHEYRLHDEIMR